MTPVWLNADLVAQALTLMLKAGIMGSWIAPKNADTCKGAVRVSRQPTPSSKAASAVDLPSNKLGILLATKIACAVTFTQTKAFWRQHR